MHRASTFLPLRRLLTLTGVLALVACSAAEERAAPAADATASARADEATEGSDREPSSGGAAAPADDDEREAPEVDEEMPGPTPTAAPAELRPGCTAKATVGGFPAWMFFTRPDRPCTGTPGSGVDNHILNELTRLIDAVPAGGRIDGHIFSISVESVALALVKAEARGVDVWLSTDGGVAASTNKAKAALDRLKHRVYCASASANGCVASAAGSISHTKLFVFSATTTPDGAPAKDVVWLGSANQTYQSGTKLFNNTVSLYGDGVLATKMRAYLDDLYARRSRADYYDPSSGRGHLLTDSADVYVSPELQTDLVVNRLDDITPDAGCEVRVMQASIRDSRLPVVARLAALKQGGCKVSIVAHTVEPKAAAALAAAGIVPRENEIHDKAFIVRARYGAGASAYRVYTGSHNLSFSAAHRYDEILVKLAAEPEASHPLYDAFVAHFDDAYADAKPFR